MDSPCIKQTVCKVLKIFQYGKYLVAYVLKLSFVINIFVLTIFERPFYKGFTVKSMENGQEKGVFFIFGSTMSSL